MQIINGCNIKLEPKDAPYCLSDVMGVFVSPNGDDANDGTKAKPFKTFGKAAEKIGQHARIYACEGFTSNRRSELA